VNEPSLFDPSPAPQFIDAKPLGDVRDVIATAEYCTIVFERGSLQLAASAFFSLSRTLSRKPTH
jgi:hypothetical protein